MKDDDFNLFIHMASHPNLKHLMTNGIRLLIKVEERKFLSEQNAFMQVYWKNNKKLKI